MGKLPLAAALVAALLATSCSRSPEDRLRRALRQSSGLVQLPSGTIELSSPLEIPLGSKDLEIAGSGDTVLRASDRFLGRALLLVRSSSQIRLRDFRMEGNRGAIATPAGIAPSDIPFNSFYQNNGILVEDVSGLEISGVSFHEIANFPILIHASRQIQISKVRITDSGSLNPKGRNNTSGGILLEEGVNDFEVRDSTFVNILGNAVWTHSRYRSPRNYSGLIAGNRFERIGRDAIQIGHANSVRVENNTGDQIGYPVEIVDVEGGGTPVAIDTAGKVDESIYSNNRFTRINGKCIDLDGFHDGEVSGNVCTNEGPLEAYPNGHFGLVMNNASIEMNSVNIVVRGNVFNGTKYGGIFVIGSGHKITGNKLLNINRAHCNETGRTYGCTNYQGDPNLLRSGIYLAARAERPDPAHDNLIENNEISGYRMSARCITQEDHVQVARNVIRNNRCTDGP